MWKYNNKSVGFIKEDIIGIVYAYMQTVNAEL